MAEILSQNGHDTPRSPRRSLTLAKCDGRTREGRLARQARADLTAHVGGRPSAVQRVLIDRAVQLTLHVARLDIRLAERGEMSEHAAREYLAWSNTLTRTLRELGLRPAAERAPSLAEHLRAHAA